MLQDLNIGILQSDFFLSALFHIKNIPTNCQSHETIFLNGTRELHNCFKTITSFKHIQHKLLSKKGKIVLGYY